MLIFLPELADTIQMKEKIVTSGYVVAGIKSIPPDSLRTRLYTNRSNTIYE